MRHFCSALYGGASWYYIVVREFCVGGKGMKKGMLAGFLLLMFVGSGRAMQQGAEERDRRLSMWTYGDGRALFYNLRDSIPERIWHLRWLAHDEGRRSEQVMDEMIEQVPCTYAERIAGVAELLNAPVPGRGRRSLQEKMAEVSCLRFLLYEPYRPSSENPLPEAPDIVGAACAVVKKFMAVCAARVCEEESLSPEVTARVVRYMSAMKPRAMPREE